MSVYYVSAAGNDSNNGLSADATTANTNKPWLTLGKALATGSPVVAGDTVYVGPGYYFSSGNITPLATISSAGTPSQIIGDPTNAQGFKDSSGVLLAPGLPYLTTRTAVEGIDAPMASTNNFFNATTNSPSGLQFKFLALETRCDTSTNSIIWNASAATGGDNLFQDCYLISSGGVFGLFTGAPTAGRNLTVRRSTIIGGALQIQVTTASATADADLAILVEECLIFGRLTGNLQISNSGGNLGGGINLYDNTIIQLDSGGNSSTIKTTALRVSTVKPINFKGNLIFGNGAVISAGTSGHVIDQGWNRFIQLGGAAVYTNTTQNVTSGHESFIGIAPNLVLPHLVTWGLEMPRADFLGWTDAAASTQAFTTSGRTTPDFRGRTARPWGAGASIGCWQAQSVAQDTGSAVSGGGANSLKITGAGEVSLYVPVDATSTTISVHTASTSYGGTTWPQLIVMPNPSIGVTTSVSVSATSASDQGITTGSFTPTAKGVVEVRLISNSTSTTSSTFFDLLTSP
jgi:hypothetical protein